LAEDGTTENYPNSDIENHVLLRSTGGFT